MGDRLSNLDRRSDRARGDRDALLVDPTQRDLCVHGGINALNKAIVG